MEFSRIQNMVMKTDATKPTTMFLNNGRPTTMPNLVMTDAAVDYDFVPFHHSTQPEQRILILDNQGVLREAFTDVSYLLSHNLPPYSDDTEIPPHVLDHMYAKKPREPGSEQAPAKPRRRAKRKEQVVEQYVIPDTQPPAPKINIIRQRLPTSVYKSLSSRPKILYGSGGGGSPPKTASGFTSSSPITSPTKGKASTSPSKQCGHLGRTNKKDEPSKTMYASFDEVNKLFTSSKFGKDSKTYKPSKQNSSAIIMDDLQRVGAAYDEDMLFDFGITEDEDNEAITCTLGTDGFSDGEFDEFGGMEVYNNSNQGSLGNLKASSLSKSPIPTSGILLNQRSPIKASITHPQLPPEISDDDDSNQIMVSIHNNNRRPSSQDWDSVQLFTDQSIKQEAEVSQSSSSLSDLCVTTTTSTKQTNNLCVDHTTKNNNKPLIESKFSKVLKKESNVNGAFTIIKEEEDSLNKSPIMNASNLTPTTTTRRSSRVVKTPAWLEDSDKTSIAKRRRKKSSA